MTQYQMVGTTRVRTDTLKRWDDAVTLDLRPRTVKRKRPPRRNSRVRRRNRYWRFRNAMRLQMQSGRFKL